MPLIEWDEESLRDEFPPRKLKRWECSDRMCGDPECGNCFPGWEDELEDE